MRYEDMLMEEEEFQREQAYLSAEKDAEFEEWLFWKEDMKADQKRKEAKIIVKKGDLIVLNNDRIETDF